MTGIGLGFEALTLEVRLAPDSDFVGVLIAEDGWPDGTVLELRFPDTAVVWPATVVGESASWDVPAAQVAAALVGGVQRVRLLCLDDDGPDLLWAAGWVVTGDRVPSAAVCLGGGPVVVTPPGVTGTVLVPVAGPRGPKGDPGSVDDLEAIQELIDDSVTVHVLDPDPHPAYDDGPSLVLLFENGLI